MKTVLNRLSFLLIGALLLSCNAVEPERETPLEISDFILENYLDDARQLYFTEVMQDSISKEYNSTTIDSAKVWEKLELLEAVYSSNTAVADTIFNISQIHAMRCYSFNSVFMMVDTEAPEIEKLAALDFPTGNSTLDSLIQVYEIDSVRTAYNYPNSEWLTLYSSGTFNMTKASREFNEISSIETETDNNCDLKYNSNGNTIYSASVSNIKTFLTFSQGVGDCPSGCFYHHNWEFLIDNKEAYFQRKYVLD